MQQWFYRFMYSKVLCNCNPIEGSKRSKTFKLRFKTADIIELGPLNIDMLCCLCCFSLRSIFSLAWSLKIFFSFFSDSIPILGYRRIPYITIGLAVILTSLTVLSFKPMPEPFYETHNCTRQTDMTQFPGNPDAPNEAFHYVCLFFLWYCGLSCADASIDGLMTQRYYCL